MVRFVCNCLVPLVVAVLGVAIDRPVLLLRCPRLVVTVLCVASLMAS